MRATGTVDRAGRVRLEQGHKRVRAYLEGGLVADTTHPRLVWEVPYYPRHWRRARRSPGLIAFLNERVDLVIEGELQQRPVTKFSSSSSIETGTASPADH